MTFSYYFSILKVLHTAVQHRDERLQTTVIDYVDLLFDKFSKADEGVYICERTLDVHKKQVNVTVKMIGRLVFIVCFFFSFQCWIF